jgi:hypothetical protein
MRSHRINHLQKRFQRRFMESGTASPGSAEPRHFRRGCRLPWGHPLLGLGNRTGKALYCKHGRARVGRYNCGPVPRKFFRNLTLYTPRGGKEPRQDSRASACAFRREPGRPPPTFIAPVGRSSSVGLVMPLRAAPSEGAVCQRTESSEYSVLFWEGNLVP